MFYKKIKIEIKLNEENEEVYAKSKISFHHGDSISECVKKCEKDIDNWLDNSANNYNELVSRIEKYCMIWEGYESCHIDRNILEKEVEAFIKNKGRK